MGSELEDLAILQLAEDVSNEVWQIVVRWGNFAKSTVGKQLVRAVDSVGANIAESYGRFHYGEKINFLYYARGSLYESKYWLNQAQNRGLIPPNQHQKLANQLTQIARQLNKFNGNLKSQKQQRTKLGEPTPEYNTGEPTLFTKSELNWLTQSPIPNPQFPIPSPQSPTNGDSHA